MTRGDTGSRVGKTLEWIKSVGEQEVEVCLGSWSFEKQYAGHIN